MYEEYLLETKTIDHRAPIIREKVLELKNGVESTIDYIMNKSET